MILRISDTLGRGMIVVLSVLAAVGVSFFAVRAAVARYGADGESNRRLQLAVRLEPGNAEYWYRLGRYQQYNLEQADAELAEASYRKATTLDPVATDAWLELATAYELDGKADEAHAAYIHAKKSYPVSADVSWRYGNFLLRQGDRVLAYTEMRRALEADPQLAAAAFSRAYRSHPNIQEILQQLLPANHSVYVEVIRQAVIEKQLAVAETVWNELMALRPRLTIDIVSRLTEALLEGKDYAAAKRTWEQGTDTMGLPPLLRASGSVVWDPSFESGITGYSFSWKYKPLVNGLSISLDRGEKLTGLQSLRLGFDGKHNPDLDAACILTVVQPKTTYNFGGWIKTNNITTENGVEFRVYSPDDPKAARLRTHEYHGTLPWTLVQGSWSSAANTHLAQVCVTREASDNPEVRISGTAWVDEITLLAQPAEHHKP